jgi:hypothetical protein
LKRFRDTWHAEVRSVSRSVHDAIDLGEVPVVITELAIHSFSSTVEPSKILFRRRRLSIPGVTLGSFSHDRGGSMMSKTIP